jgi:hypothetical protein
VIGNVTTAEGGETENTSTALFRIVKLYSEFAKKSSYPKTKRYPRNTLGANVVFQGRESKSNITVSGATQEQFVPGKAWPPAIVPLHSLCNPKVPVVETLTFVTDLARTIAGDMSVALLPQYLCRNIHTLLHQWLPEYTGNGKYLYSSFQYEKLVL